LEEGESGEDFDGGGVGCGEGAGAEKDLAVVGEAVGDTSAWTRRRLGRRLVQHRGGCGGGAGTWRGPGDGRGGTGGGPDGGAGVEAVGEAPAVQVWRRSGSGLTGGGEMIVAKVRV
jgi:hypothetical protein